MNNINRPSSRQAFTLVELLVTVVIIGLLAGLLLPAVQSTRETARRMQCSNRLRQIGLTCHNFESTFQHLPSAVSTKSPPALRTWLFDLLPYMENTNLHEEGLQEYAGQPYPFLHSSFFSLVPNYQCPSDPAAGSVHWTTEGSGEKLVAIANYLGVNGRNGHENSGVIFCDSQIRFQSITDGLSNTLLAGERPPSNDFWFGWWYAGAGYDGRGTADSALGVLEQIENPSSAVRLGHCLTQVYRFERGNNSMCDSLHYWSYHPGGGNFALCDGSVRFFSYGSANTLPVLATRADGEVNQN